MAPVIRIVPTGHPLPDGAFDAVVFTSAHGVEAVSGAPSVTGLLDLPCFCVGARTCAEARGLGFHDIRSAQADADRLSSLLVGAFVSPAAVLFITGRDHKPVVRRTLTGVGHTVTSVEAYAADAISSWDDTVAEAFRARHVDAALHYSHRTAGLAVAAAATADCIQGFLAATHHCLSSDAAEPLRRAGAHRIVEAERPDELALLTTLTLGLI